MAFGRDDVDGCVCFVGGSDQSINWLCDTVDRDSDSEMVTLVPCSHYI